MAYGSISAERQALEMTYEGLCTVTEFQSVKDPATRVTRLEPIVVLLEEPCALSQASLASAKGTDTDQQVRYDAKLFLSPDVVIKAGSRIRVQQHGMELEFEHVGHPFRYPTHQEVMLQEVSRA
ncbi:ABC transporter ATP-binding protein [Paenibacillus sp. YYML68]|uniref:ABC transporter ATP-binding protein n=1 Tax=Paenibacillus sp. YYML68 TaxID=2909250 RepID=UPI002490F7BE|nr:ABC transporter ATP-binding protein [Paenibacillus sp. YYML68]